MSKLLLPLCAVVIIVEGVDAAKMLYESGAEFDALAFLTALSFVAIKLSYECTDM